MTLKNILIIIVITGLGWWFLANYNSKPAETPEVNNPPKYVEVNHMLDTPETTFFTPLDHPIEIKSNMELCFANFSLSTWDDGSYYLDGGKMRLSITGKKVTGESYYAISGKDSWRSMFEGVISNFALPITVDALEESQSEGSIHPKEKVKLVLNGTEVKVMRQETTLTYSDNDAPAVLCDELTEWEGVNADLVKKELYPDYTLIDYQENTGYFLSSYNSAPKQEKINFSYTTNDQHKVLDLKLAE